MPLSQLKNVKWSDDERVDLDDLSAASSLKDADIRELLLAFMEAPVNGRVYTGFTGSAGVGLNFNFNGVDSLAVASDGSLLETVAAASLSTPLPASSSVYIHAFLVEQDSDLDNRRFLNDIPVPAEEVTLNTPTRQTKAVGLHVTQNNDAVLQLGSFQTSAFLSGKTRKLVALYAMKTDGAGVVGGSVIDFRTMWMVSGNQIPAVNGGVNELPFTVGGSNGDRNVKGLRSMFQAIASVLRTISGTTSQDWWSPPTTLQEVMDARTDTATGQTRPSLKTRVDAAKSATATVSETANRGDYPDPATGSSAFTAGNGSLYIKAGAYPNLNNNGVSFGSTKPNMKVSGDGPGATSIRYATIANHGTICDMTVRQNASDGAADAEQVTIYNVKMGFAASGANSKRIKYVGCTINPAQEPFGSNFFVTSITGGTGPGFPANGEVIFIGCHFIPRNGSTTIFDMSSHRVTQNFKFIGCTFGDPGVAAWEGLVGSITSTGLGSFFGGAYSGTQISEHSLSNIVFEGCTFWNMNRMFNASGAGDRNQITLSEVVFRGCSFKRDIGGTAQPMFAWGTYPREASVVRFHDCDIVWPGMLFNFATGIPAFPGTYKKCDVEMVGCRVIAGSAVVAPFFNMTCEADGNLSIRGCKFDYNLNTQNGAVVSWVPSGLQAGTSHYLVFDGCEFSASRSNVPYSAFFLDSALSIVNNLCLVIRGEFIGNLHASQVPIRITGTHSGVLSVQGDYIWHNGTAGGATDPAIDSAGSGGTQRRITENVLRMLNAT